MKEKFQKFIKNKGITILFILHVFIALILFISFFGAWLEDGNNIKNIIFFILIISSIIYIVPTVLILIYSVYNIDDIAKD